MILTIGDVADPDASIVAPPYTAKYGAMWWRIKVCDRQPAEGERDSNQTVVSESSEEVASRFSIVAGHSCGRDGVRIDPTPVVVRSPGDNVVTVPANVGLDPRFDCEWIAADGYISSLAFGLVEACRAVESHLGHLGEDGTECGEGWRRRWRGGRR